MAEAIDNYSDLELSEDESDSLDSQFSRAANHLKTLVSRLDNKKLLELYSYYKQGTEGPCNTPRPRWFDTQGKMKWDAWNTLGDLQQDVAKQTYISLINQLDPSFSSNNKDQGKTESSWAAVSTLVGEDDNVPEVDKTIADFCREGRIECVAKLLKESPTLGLSPDSDGLFPIHWAADRGHTDIVDVLLSCCGSDITEQKDLSGQTALHYAASCGHVEVVRALLAAGACRSAQDLDGNTPLDLVTDAGVEKLLQMP